MTRLLSFHTVLLAFFVTGCLPDPDDGSDGPPEPPKNGCRASYLEVGSERWQIDGVIRGASSTTLPGELAPVGLDVALSEWPSEHLTDMRIELTVSAGQALPGHVLTLRLGSEPLQEVPLAGPHGNEAIFDVELARDSCGTPCEFTLQLSGEPALSNVPVPLKLNGTLFAFLDSTRETRSCAEDQLKVVVGDAP